MGIVNFLLGLVDDKVMLREGEIRVDFNIGARRVCFAVFDARVSQTRTSTICVSGNYTPIFSNVRSIGAYRVHTFDFGQDVPPSANDIRTRAHVN